MPSLLDIQKFLDDMESEDNLPPISEAKVARLDNPESFVVITEDDTILGIGVAATHPQSGGTLHWSVETAVPRSMRFPAFETAVLSAAIDLVPKGSAMSVWSARTSLASALDDFGFAAVRSLAYMVVSLPMDESSQVREHDDFVVRQLREDDTDAFLIANADAFRDHREAASLTKAEFDDLKTAAWFDASGLLVAEQGQRLIGFCWTKVHPNGDGEIYRIGVVHDEQGRGVARTLLDEGFRHLSRQEGVTRGSLWVDESNTGAVDLYVSAGMRAERTTKEFEDSRKSS
ncbi:MAG: GNAT family N-acetyltransferase [Acidimicrobiia bacterium]